MILPPEPALAVAGATGAVGREFLALLERSDLPVRSLRLLASERSAGRKVTVRGREHEVGVLGAGSFAGVDLAFFSCGGDRSREFAPAAVEAGAIVVDNSSAFRMEPGVPLVVPEVNAAALFDDAGGLAGRIVANPNCSTIIMCLALAPLHAAFGLRRVVVSTYQAASGAGEQAMLGLAADTGAVLDRELDPRGLVDFGAGHERCRQAFGHPLAFNLVPQIDVFLPDGRTKEERKMEDETRKILGVPALPVEATCVRVPVLRSHAVSVTVETEAAPTPAAAREVLAAASGLRVEDEPGARRYPMPSLTSGVDEVLVGRVREARVFERGLSLFVCGDQLLKGAALNGWQILEALRRGPGGARTPA
ncbi:MAG: aspartate-semialdehyde dehydrogenase [Planctomycetota bacterium]